MGISSFVLMKENDAVDLSVTHMVFLMGASQWVERYSLGRFKYHSRFWVNELGI
jgi:hypothetical protein